MRNLKRALSLTLASVMLLGMMVVGSSAAGYPDVDDADNVEAIEVLQAVKVMQGDEYGNFRPDDSVSRAEMAVVMANLLDLDYQYYEAACPFTDVPAWARGYVGACYANGIVSGYNATTYGASDGVTAVQAASMMMRALGYFQYASDYADGFEVSTVRQGTRIGIFTDVGSNASDAMSRNQVAQMALNALEATMVDARKTSADITVGSGDTAVSISGSVEYIVRTGATNDKMATAIKRGVQTGTGTDGTYGETIELGEQLYNGDLKKETYEANSVTDAFGAPATRWVYKNTEIGKYADTTDATYTAEVKVKDIYADLGLSGTVKAGLVVDGTDAGTVPLTKSGSEKLGGNGVLVKAYETGEKDVTISVINPYVGEVTKVTAAKDGDPRTVTVGGLKYETEGFAEDDVVVYTKAGKDIQSMYLADTVSDVEVTRTVGNSEFTANGNVYKYASSFSKVGADTVDLVTTGKDDVKTENRLDLYLDAYGYVVKVDLSEGSTNYAYVLDIGEDNARFGSGTPYAKLLCSDGTVVEAKLDYDDYNKVSSKTGLEKALEYCIVQYSVNSKDVYKLEVMKNGDKTEAKISDEANVEINSGKAAMTLGEGNTYYADSKTIFLVDDGDKNYSAYVGYDEVPTLKGTAAEDESKYAVYCEGNSKVATVVYVFKASASSDDIVFLLGTECKNATKETGKDQYYECPAVVNGELTTVKLNNKISKVMLLGTIVYSNADDGIISTTKSKEYVKDTTKDNFYIENKKVTMKLTSGNLAINSVSYRVADDVQVFVYDDEIDSSSVGSIAVGDSGYFVVNDGKLVAIFYKEGGSSSADETGLPSDEVKGSTITINLAEATADSGSYLINYLREYDSVTVDNKNDSAYTGSIYVSNGKTLAFTGDIGATASITLATGATLLVDGTYTTSSASDVTFGSGTVVHATKLTTDSSKKLTISGTVTVDKELTVGNGGITLNGDLTVSEGTDTTNVEVVKGTGKITVKSANSLHITGIVASGVTIQANDDAPAAGTNGRIVIEGTMKGKLIDKNVGDNAPTQAITSIEGEITMSAKAKLTTREFKPSKIVKLEIGATITLEEGTDNANINVTDKNGNTIDTGEEEVTIVIGMPVDNKTITPGNKEDVVADATTINEGAPFTAAAIVVYDGDSWDNAVNKGYKPVRPLTTGSREGKAPLWADFSKTNGSTASGAITETDKANYSADHGVTTFPWLLAKIDVEKEIPVDTVITAKVYKNNIQVGTASMTVSESALAEGETKTFHWDMANDRHDAGGGASPVLNQNDKNLDGTYEIQINWTVNGAAVTDQTPVTASASYTTPEIITNNYQIGDQEVIVDNAARTIHVKKAITLEGNTDKVPGTNMTLKEYMGNEVSWVKVIVLEISNTGTPFVDLKVKYPSGTAKDDSFDNGKTYAIIGVKGTEGSQDSFTVILSGASGTDGSFTSGKQLELAYTIDWDDSVRAGIDGNGEAASND